MLAGPALLDLDREHPETLIREWLGGWCDSASAEEAGVSAPEPERILFSGKVKAPMPEPDDRGRVSIALPMPPAGLAALLPPAANLAHGACERVLFSPGPADVHLAWKVRAPEGRSVLPAAAVEAECPGGELAIRRNGEAPRVETELTLLWDGRAVPPGAYRDYRAFLLKVLDEKAVRIVLGAEKKGS
jgi:hypothetical protein